ncbi:MAG: hypothetical protein EOP00_30475 [Pedobacter sp.]|nr:MAG: hypothetical protein EOP00_30475 [Pedobacter sp.]
MTNVTSTAIRKNDLKATLLMILLVSLFVACAGKKKAETKITYKSKIFTEQFLIDYVNENQDLNSDDSLTFANALDKFQRDIKGVSNNPDFLVDFPLQATNIRDTVMGNQSFKMATFETYNDPLRDKNGLLNNIQLRVNGIFQFPDQAYGLALGGKYYLKAMIYKQGKRKDVNLYKKEGGPIYNLGVYPMAVKELKPIPSKIETASLN